MLLFFAKLAFVLVFIASNLWNAPIFNENRRRNQEEICNTAYKCAGLNSEAKKTIDNHTNGLNKYGVSLLCFTAIDLSCAMYANEWPRKKQQQ